MQFWQVHGEEGWNTLLEALLESPYLCGENKDHFVALFGWVLDPIHTEKILKGGYKKFPPVEGKTFPPSEDTSLGAPAIVFPLPDGFLQSFNSTGRRVVFWDYQIGGWYDTDKNQWHPKDRDTDWVMITSSSESAIATSGVAHTEVFEKNTIFPINC